MNTQGLKENILSAMTLAPSAHNTQPWKFRVGENSVEVLVDWSRHLSASDPTGRQMYVSLGCTIMNGVVAAAKEGMATEITYFPEGEEKDKSVARLAFTQGNPDQYLASLYPAIAKRRTNRFLYDGQPLETHERAALKAVGPNAFLVEDRQQIEQLAEATEQGTYKTLSQPEFKEELSHWVRNSWTKQPDGMPGYAMGMPALLSLVAPIMVKKAPIHKQEGPKTKQQIASASAIAVVATERDTKFDWLKAGQLFEQLWLEATQAGLATAALAAAIEAGDEERNKVKKVVGTQLYPQAILRLGHSDKKDLKPTPRRTVEECIAS